jgi:hypothetical protein
MQSTICHDLAYPCVCLLGDQHWEFISLPHPLSLGKIVFCPSPLLSVLYYIPLFVFQICRAVRFCMLSSGSGDHLCDPLHALIRGVAYLLPAVSLRCLSCVCLLIVQH